MPRFYFHVRSPDDFIEDEEGTPLPDLAAARNEAEASAQGILANALKAGKPVDGQTFEVADEGGVLLFTYLFREAVSLP